MLLLSNSDLPATSQGAISKAPLLRVATIASPNIRPPFVRVGTFAGYGLRPGFNTVNVDLPAAPAYVGRYFRLVFNVSATEDYSVSSVSLVALNGQSYSVIADPNDIGGVVTNTAWANTQAINLYAPAGTNQGETITAAIALDEQIPIPDTDLNYTIDISEFIGSNIFTVSRVVSEGLSFSLAVNSGNPQTGEFTQTGGVIKLYGSGSYQPRTLRPVQIEGVWQADLPPFTAAISTFDLSSLNVGIVDELTYLGIVCRPAADLYSLGSGDLLATRDRASAFVPYDRALWVRDATTASNYVSGLTELTYQSSIQE